MNTRTRSPIPRLVFGNVPSTTFPNHGPATAACPDRTSAAPCLRALACQPWIMTVARLDDVRDTTASRLVCRGLVAQALANDVRPGPVLRPDEQIDVGHVVSGRYLPSLFGLDDRPSRHT